jgi:hypothetical protein
MKTNPLLALLLLLLPASSQAASKRAPCADMADVPRRMMEGTKAYQNVPAAKAPLTELGRCLADFMRSRREYCQLPEESDFSPSNPSEQEAELTRPVIKNSDYLRQCGYLEGMKAIHLQARATLKAKKKTRSEKGATLSDCWKKELQKLKAVYPARKLDKYILVEEHGGLEKLKAEISSISGTDANQFDPVVKKHEKAVNDINSHLMICGSGVKERF